MPVNYSHAVIKIKKKLGDVDNEYIDMPRTDPKLNVGPAEDRIWRILNFFILTCLNLM